MTSPPPMAAAAAQLWCRDSGTAMRGQPGSTADRWSLMMNEVPLMSSLTVGEGESGCVNRMFHQMFSPAHTQQGLMQILNVRGGDKRTEGSLGCPGSLVLSCFSVTDRHQGERC